jgi:uncharacterized protein (TIGR02266 family)
LNDAERQAEPAEVPRPRLLVVEEVPLFRELEAAFLAPMGHVVSLQSAREARESIQAAVPDVLVISLQLPDLPGDLVCRALRAREDTKDLPVVIVTGGSADDYARAVRAGASDVLSKPLSRRTLLEAVGRFLRPKALTRSLTRVPVEVPVVMGDGEQQARGTIRNLSRGGLFVESGWLPREGSEVSLSFSLESGARTFRPTGQLVWRRLSARAGRPGLGMRFLALDGDTWHDLADFVYERAPLLEAGPETRPLTG